MRKFYVAVLFLTLLIPAVTKAQPPAAVIETPCTMLSKLLEEFPNNFTTFVGEPIDLGDENMFTPNDNRFQSKIALPGSKETYFYNQLFKKTNIYYVKFYEGPDTTQARVQFNKWRLRLEGCPYEFGTLAAAESDDITETKVVWTPFDLGTPDLEKKYGALMIEFKLFKGSKVTTQGEYKLNYTVEMKVMRASP